ncbi:hypothetical protein ACHAPT_002693 [Fusarium lateritium]
MSVVAVAGGTGGIGRAIVEMIVADGRFQVIVLSRKEGKSLQDTLGAPIFAIDYLQTESVTAFLQERDVGTVICALGGPDPTDPQLALIQASDQSTVTKRFIPSVFGARYRKDQSWFLGAAPKLAAEAALEKTQLEWTMVCNGWFLDYWGMPKIKSYLNPLVLAIDVAAMKAAIPGSGTTPITFTYSFDVAKYTAALLGLEKWQKVSYVIGDKLSWNKLLQLAEATRGEKFDVTYDPLDLLRQGQITELPSQVAIYSLFPKEVYQNIFATFGIILDEGLLDFQFDQAVNRLFPEIVPKSAREVLEIGWGN